MELSCELAPAALAAYYSSTQELGLSGVDERLEDLDFDVDWALRVYSEIARAGAGLGEDDPFKTISEAHAKVLSWLLVGERSRQRVKPSDLEVQVSSWIANESAVVVPPDRRPVVVAWTIGRQIAPGTWLRLPAIPPFEPRDPDVAAAYRGFLSHISHVANLDYPEEVTITSVVWRVGALVDGIDPRGEDGASVESRLRGLVGRFRPMLGYDEETWCDRACRDFTDDRNVLTHISQRGGKSFREVVSMFGTHGDIHAHGAAISAVIFDLVADEQAEEALPQGVLDEVVRDLEMWERMTS